MKFTIRGIVCDSCRKKIHDAVMSIDGVSSCSISSNKANIKFDAPATEQVIFSKIESLGYSCHKNNLLFILGILVTAFFLFQITDYINIPTITDNISYSLLFVIGLLTGFHCIAMCGGFVVSYTARDAQKNKSSHLSHVFYGAGKLISYTLIGALFGFFGSIIAFTPTMRGIAGLLAGVFLILFGLNMFGFLPQVRFKTPSFINKRLGKNNSPLSIGLLNGLMIACGPLQAIYIMAAGTGSMIEGAKLLFIFGLGTLPVMLGFGYFASFISKKATNKLLRASGAIVILLGIMMISNGLTVAGYSFTSTPTSAATVGDYQEVHMAVTRSGWEPDTFNIQPNIPVKWIIDGQEINGCNNEIMVPDMDLNFKIKPGIQTIEFTPTEEGVIPFSCWMGMIPGKFIVGEVADISLDTASQNLPVCGGTCGCRNS